MLHFCVFEAVFVNYLSSPSFDWRNPISIEKSSLVSRYTSNSSNNNYIRPCDKEEKEIVLFFLEEHEKLWGARIVRSMEFFVCINEQILCKQDYSFIIRLVTRFRLTRFFNNETNITVKYENTNLNMKL